MGALENDRQQTCRDMGRKGGLARTEKYGIEQTWEWSRMGGLASAKLPRQSPEFYRERARMGGYAKAAYGKKPTGPRVNRQPLQDWQRLEMLRWRQEGHTIRDIADRFGCSRFTVYTSMKMAREILSHQQAADTGDGQ